MGFDIEEGQPDAKLLWMPLDTATPIAFYIGQLVKTYSISGAINGCAPIAQAAGLADYNSGARQIIDGIVMGFNNYPMTEQSDSTFGAYMASVASAANQKAILKMGQEGMFSKGDPQPLAQIAKLTPSTVIKGPYFTTTYGTALTVLTASGTPTTTAITVNAAQFTPTTANLSTVYCRTGVNAGLYRPNSGTTTTALTFTTAWPTAPAAGDTFVAVPQHVGSCMMQVNGTTGYIGTFIDAAVAPATNYFIINVHELNLKEAGKEYCLFQFNPIHFTDAVTT